MEIVVMNKTIETKNIATIVEVDERDTAGFEIHFRDNTKEVFKEKYRYETYPSDARIIHEKWDRRRKEVVDLWNKDKIDIPIIK